MNMQAKVERPIAAEQVPVVSSLADGSCRIGNMRSIVLKNSRVNADRIFGSLRANDDAFGNDRISYL